MRKPCVGHIPSIIFAIPGNDSDTNAGIHEPILHHTRILRRGTRIVDRRCADSSSSRSTGLRRSRDKYSWHQLRRQEWTHLKVRHLIKLSVESDTGGAFEKLLDDCRVLNHSFVAFVMRGGVIECDKIILKPTSEHVEIYASSIK